MTYSLVSGSITVDLGTMVTERILSQSNLQVMSFPTSDASMTDVFDYSGVERRISVRGVFANATLAETTLSADVTSNSSTFIVGSTSSFASSGTALIDQELVTYTGKTLNTLTGVVRGRYNTTAIAHESGARVLQNQAVALHALESGSQTAITYNSDLMGVLFVKVEKVETDINAGSPALINYSFELIQSSRSS